jgi:pimeloyl-ACP methyl ester carboxylesterase
VENALGYYRAMIQFPGTHPEASQRMLTEPIGVPTMLVMGDHDLALIGGSQDDEKLFSAEFRFEPVAGAGHFVQRQQPETLTKLIVEWLGEA